jgi:tetratricopeptide (TPR) repeat protein
MSGNGDYGVVRNDVLADARERARTLAAQGLPAHEIEHRLEHDLTSTEREILWAIAQREVAAAHRSPPEASPGVPAARTVHERWEQASHWFGARLKSGGRRSAVPAAVPVALAGVVAGILIGLVIAHGGDRQGASSRRAEATPAHRSGAASHGKRRTTPSKSESRPPHETAPAAPPEPPVGQAPAPSRQSQIVTAGAAALNDRGFQLMNEGRYEDAIPLLRRAVSVARPASGDLTYAYALYNLGRSLRLAGRPDEAIPLLERRLQIDNQRPTVARELKAARRSTQQTGGAR